jgi:hypothetical protein
MSGGRAGRDGPTRSGWRGGLLNKAGLEIRRGRIGDAYTDEEYGLEKSAMKEHAE